MKTFSMFAIAFCMLTGLGIALFGLGRMFYGVFISMTTEDFYRLTDANYYVMHGLICVFIGVVTIGIGQACAAAIDSSGDSND